jgi:diguanylate cyclase (GGDEF)-like protein
MSVLLAVLLAVVLVSRRQLAQALRRAHSDVVTGLPNRAAVDEALVRMISQAERGGTPLAVAMLDIDHFKMVNDDLGHAKGDEVLAAVGSAARREVRTGDFVGRFGGEELLLLLPETDEAGALAVAEKLRLRIGRLEVPGTGRAVTASFGVAAASGGQAELRELVPAADAALYRAKEKGRDRCELASAAAAAFTAV